MNEEYELVLVMRFKKLSLRAGRTLRSELLDFVGNIRVFVRDVILCFFEKVLYLVSVLWLFSSKQENRKQAQDIFYIPEGYAF